MQAPLLMKPCNAPASHNLARVAREARKLSSDVMLGDHQVCAQHHLQLAHHQILHIPDVVLPKATCKRWMVHSTPVSLI